MDSNPSEVGQFIPLHYHFQMLRDTERMRAFRETLERFVPVGGTVVELGGGTGVLSWFAAQRAERVFCVEYNPQMVEAARHFLQHNPGGERVEVIQGDAARFIPPCPVDMVICEMLHTAFAREKQLEVIAAFKAGYIRAFPNHPLPRFVPEAALQAIQAVSQDYCFEGYCAPVPLFQDPRVVHADCVGLSDPVLFHTVDYGSDYSLDVHWEGNLAIHTDGVLNGLRLILKNLVGIMVEEGRSLDWHTQYMVMPLPHPLEVRAGEQVRLRIAYPSGCSLETLASGLVVQAPA